MPKSGESKLKPFLFSVSSSSILTWKKKKKKKQRTIFPPLEISLPNFYASTWTPPRKEGRGGEGERVDKKKPRKRRGVEESGRRRERERERVGGGVWRARAVSQPSPVPTYPCTSESARRVATVGVGNDGERIFPLVGRATSAR